MRNHSIRKRIIACLVITTAFVTGCASTPRREDPLRNTKKLVSEGHATLYQNGAFRVPNTSISLIPPGPSTIEFVQELAGMRARQSFELSLRNAAESVYIVSEGSRRTYKLAGSMSRGSNEAAEAIRKASRENSTLLVYRSTDLGKSIIGESWDFSKKTFQQSERAGNSIVGNSSSAGNAVNAAGTALGVEVAAQSIEAGKQISRTSTERSGETLGFAGNAFVRGYAAVPQNMKERATEMVESLSDAGLGSIIQEHNRTRSEWSQKTVDLMSDTIRDYPSDVASKFNKAGKEFDGAYTTTGMSLAMLKSIRWVLEGILWDATIEPIAKMTTASLGYISVNFAAFPSLVVMHEGVATTKLALEVTWNTARLGYDVVAPTAIAAVAGVFGIADYTISQTAAGATVAAGNVLGYTGAGMSKAAGVLVKGGGYAAGKGTQYIGIPLASAGIAIGGGTVGTVVGGVGAASGGALRVAGETGAAATQVFGNTLAGTTLVAGSAASTAAGAGYGVYELSKAVVVPSGYELGSGMVLSYGTMAHLGAHSILAVSDCAYLVLSLEGPRWVIYAVKGKTGSGEDLPVGAVLDLKKMQQSGEEIEYLPVSDEEMRKVVESVYENLPEVKDQVKPEAAK